MAFDIIWANSIGDLASLYYSWVQGNGCTSIFSWRYINPNVSDNMSCLTCRMPFLNAKDAHSLKCKLPPQRLGDLCLLHQGNLQLLFKNCITVSGWWLINKTYLSCFHVNLETNQKWSSNQHCISPVNCNLMIHFYSSNNSSNKTFRFPGPRDRAKKKY